MDLFFGKHFTPRHSPLKKIKKKKKLAVFSLVGKLYSAEAEGLLQECV